MYYLNTIYCISVVLLAVPDGFASVAVLGVATFGLHKSYPDNKITIQFGAFV